MARKKSTLSPESKKILTKQREAARRDAAKAKARTEKLDRQRRKAEIELAAAEENNRRRSAAVNAIRDRAQTVAASWSVRPKFFVAARGGRIRAWTDFQSVHVDYPSHLLPAWNAATGQWEAASTDWYGNDRIVGQGDLFLGLTGLLGALYHEIGHIRFTTPWPTMLETLGHKPDEEVASKLAWNILEDQRMERAVVQESPVIGSYFSKLVTEHISDYLLVVGRDYLPAKFCRALRQIAVEQHGEDRVIEAEDIVWAYISAPTHTLMFHAVQRLTRWMQQAEQQADWRKPSNATDHSNMRQRSQEQTPDPEGSATQAPTQDAASGDSKAPSKGEDHDGEDGEPQDAPTDGGSADGESDASSEADNGQGGKLSRTDAVQKIAAEVDRATQQLAEELLNDENLLEQLHEMTHEMADISNASRFPEAETEGFLSVEAEAEAEREIRTMTHALEVALSEGAPHWAERQREGVLNPLVYRTRQPGDRDFYRAWTGNEDPGANIVVSLVLDCSGSMSTSMVALGQAAWVTGRACKSLGVTFRAFTFGSSNQAGVLSEYEPGGVDTLAPIEPASLGSTNPQQVLEWVSTLDTEGKDHLVIIMTDGVFDTPCAKLHIPALLGFDTKVLGIGFSQWSQEAARSNAESLRNNNGIRDAVGTTKLSEIPRQVENFLRHTLGGR